ncbi:hypothetical protein [Ochrobactrum sp. AN78]|uniref:hypothetical protein n=1 Tax=Ochrobactrum sp. AN78 TaxID=3039853 RepID=UPI002989F2B7|nr:hypothetical protein [Ochrobactrum sp. AN78]
MSNFVPVHAQDASPVVPQPEAQAVQSTRFDDWYYRCAEVKAADGKTVSQCEVAQIAQVKQGEENVNVLTLAIAKTAPEAGKKPSGNEL